jgi:hypothetical protein
MGIVDFDEETAVTIIATTFHDKATAYAQNYRCSFNPTGKIVELCDALVQSEKEKVALL